MNSHDKASVIIILSSLVFLLILSDMLGKLDIEKKSLCVKVMQINPNIQCFK